MNLQDPSIAGQSVQSEPTVYIVEPTTVHVYTIILLHGLGSNGEKFGKELLETGTTSSGRTLSQLLPSARFVFPTAKRRRSSAFKRSLLMQWFDIVRLPDPEFRKEKQLQGLAESALDLGELLRKELSGISPHNVIIGGISQGCAMSLSMLLSLEQPLGGFVGMCGFLPLQKDIEDAVGDESTEADDDDPFAPEEKHSPEDPAVKAQVFERDLLCLPPLLNTTGEKTARSTPIFLGHGDADEKKPHILGEAATRTMRAAGYDVVWKLYPELGHWYKVPYEIDDIVDFIRTKVGWNIIDEGHG
ncbi:phospholipase/carboxylesterase [Biscogniauxia marginata]|nr:phospholipase/carboxylesterase [Biscogniauxia marginata]